LDITAIEAEILYSIQLQIRSRSESLPVYGFFTLQRKGILTKIIFQGLFHRWLIQNSLVGTLSIENRLQRHLAGTLKCSGIATQLDVFATSSCSSFDCSPQSELQLLLPQADEFFMQFKSESQLVSEGIVL
jgi:hypothetical protein